MNTQILKLNDESCKLAARLINAGEVVAFPTETVYGLGANVFNEDAVKKIFSAKGRPNDNPLIVHVADKDQIQQVAAQIPSSADMLIDAFMPGPITMVLPKRPEIPYSVTGGLDTVGVRLPSHEGARKFIKACGCPIPAPSANSSGKPSPTNAQHVYDDLFGKIPLILDGGECTCGVESTVISLAGPTPLLLRPGLVTYEMLCSVLGKVEIHPSVLKNGLVDKAASPGMKYKHYSPKARVIILDTTIEKASMLYDEAVKLNRTPVLLWQKEAIPAFCGRSALPFFEENDTALAARNLFGLLRKCDDDGYDTVFISAVSTTGVGLSVMNRMLRASAFTVLDSTADASALKSVLQIN